MIGYERAPVVFRERRQGFERTPGTAQSFDARDEPAVSSHCFGDRSFVACKMFGEQAVAQCGDRIADLLVALRFDRQVAFGIQAYRASAQDSRPNGEDLVVANAVIDDDELLVVR